MPNDFYNSEGYPDPTAYCAMRTNKRFAKAKFIIKIILFIAWEAGYRVVGKIELEDRQTGRRYW